MAVPDSHVNACVAFCCVQLNFIFMCIPFLSNSLYPFLRPSLFLSLSLSLPVSTSLSTLPLFLSPSVTFYVILVLCQNEHVICLQRVLVTAPVAPMIQQTAKHCVRITGVILAMSSQLRRPAKVTTNWNLHFSCG